MSSYTNPRRSNGLSPSKPSCRKGATFHAPSSPSSSSFMPPSLPRRSQTSLEDVIDGKKRRAALVLEDFERIHDASPSASPTVQSYRDEGLPFLHGLLQNTIQSPTAGDQSEKMAHKKQGAIPVMNERKASLRPQRQTRHAAHPSDSGLGSSIQTHKSSARDAVGAINLSAAPASHRKKLQPMSQHASDVVHQHILQKLLANKSFKDFHPLVQDCPRAIKQSEIVCVRDLEKTLILGGPVSNPRHDIMEQLAHWNIPLKHRAKTADLYLRFCESLLICIRTALVHGNLSNSEQTRPQDRPYTPGYFTDLVAQVQQAALRIAASKEKEAKGEKLDEMDATSSDEYKLHGGLAINGRPAELVRMKDDGTAISLATGEAVQVEEVKSNSMKRSLTEDDDDEVYRSMARRKKHLSAEDLAPKVCREAGCGKSFKRPCDLTKHEKTHSRPWKCIYPECRYNKEGWPTEKELLRHANDRHSAEPKMFKCEYEGCTYQSKRDSNRKQHMEKAHGYNYVRTKSNGRKKADGSAKSSTTLKTGGLPTPKEQSSDDFENQTNGSVMYEQSSYSPDAFDEKNGSVQYQNSAYSPDAFDEQIGSGSYGNSTFSPDYPSLQEYSPNLDNDIDMDMDMSMELMPQLHVENYMDSPNSNLRHGSTDSSIPSPYGSDLLAGFHLQDNNGAFPINPGNNQFDYDFDLFNNTHTAHHMQLPEPSVYQRPLPEFIAPSCENNGMQQISPGGHGNHVLYTPTSLQSVDEGFDEYSAGDDFPLFAPAATDLQASRVPLFGEVDSSNDLYPSFLNTQECMDMSWDMNSSSQ